MTVTKDIHSATRTGTRIETAAAALSLLAVLAAVWWWAVPAAYPFSARDPLSLVSGPWTGLESLALAALGSAGVITALAMRRPSASPWVRRLLVTTAAVEIGVLLGIAADARALIFLGYSLALLGPVALLTVLAVGAWRYPPARWALAAAVVVVVGAGVVTGIGLGVPVALWRQVGSAMLNEKGLGVLAIGLGFTSGLLWMATLVRYSRRLRGRCVSCGRPGTAQHPGQPLVDVARWGRWVTIAAALGPVPYGLIRLTWLTPWPWFAPGAEELAAQPEMRLMGLSLGLAALGGSVLTIGLIRPWGEVWPRWIPWLRGRTVPALLPTTLGLVVGGAVTVAGKSFVGMVADQPEQWPMLLIFPFLVWGPLLVAASLAYYLRRRARCRRCGQL
jgi:hypothetical protein